MKTADISISTSVIREFSTTIGRELQEATRDQAQQHADKTLTAEKPEAPDVAAVTVDGGRILTREAGRGRGVHAPGWKETKQACLLTLSSTQKEDDPHPELPRCFTNQAHVEKIVKEVHSRSTSQPQANTEKSVPAEDTSLIVLPADETSALPMRPTSDKPEWRPKKLVRTCIGTMACSDDFGPLVAGEAKRRGFYEANRRAFLGDGLPWNWSIHKAHFKDFVPILDFIHPVGYLYKAAQAMKPDAHWPIYLDLITKCWQGQVATVIEILTQWLASQPSVTDDTNEKDPRLLVQKCRGYLANNKDRMDYPRYRKLGLPTSTSPVESLIKEVNFRTKGTEKFWNRNEGAEAILAVRNAAIGDDDKLSNWILNRPGCPYYRPQKAAAAAAA